MHPFKRNLSKKILEENKTFQRRDQSVVLNSVCYFPVVLWAKEKPLVGMLMMPKTLAYVWMICMGLGLIGG